MSSLWLPKGPGDARRRPKMKISTLMKRRKYLMARQVALAGSFALALERARECAYKGEALALLEAWAKAELTDTRVKMTEAVLVKVRELAAEGWSAYMMAKNSMEWFGVRLGQTTIERHVEPIWVRQGIRNPDLRHKSRS